MSLVLKERLVGQHIIRNLSKSGTTKQSGGSGLLHFSNRNKSFSRWQAALSTTTSTTTTSDQQPGTNTGRAVKMAPRSRYLNPKGDQTLLVNSLNKPHSHGYRTMSTTSSSTNNQKIPFKPWPVAVVESHGDYRAEAWLEEHIGGPLYKYQQTLPKLPIPSIDETMKRLTPTMMPLVEETPKQVNELNDAVSKFPMQANELQQRLKERASGDYSNSSYLQHWWNTLGYLSVRDSVVINVSYFFHLADDTTLPPHNVVPRNVARASAILHAVAEYRLNVCSGEMKQETIGRPPKETPICSAAFKYMFNACRIPHREMDSYKMYDPSKHTHVIIARHDRFYRMDFVHPTTQEPLSLAELQNGLLTILDMASSDNERKNGLPIGILTSQDRDSWADARDELLSVGGMTAQQAFEELESGSLLICLDDATPTSRAECGKQFLYGGHVEEKNSKSSYNNRYYDKSKSYNNRYYDKSIQIFVQENGKVGMLGEHSMMDGMPLVGLANHICSSTYYKVASKQTNESRASPAAVKDIFQECQSLWSLSPKLQDMVDHATRKHNQAMDDQSLEVQAFMGYGSSKIKQMGYSPDAFVQMAIQLATYRLWNGQQGATYEATQTRPFLHGRTETTRSVSPASAYFCQVMGDFSSTSSSGGVSKMEKIAALQKAVQSHVAYIKDAAKGHGVDRHLLGLALLVKDNEPSPDLFGHPIYTKAKTWRVSTSHLSHPQFDNWGFGQVVPHGVGVGYGILPQKVVFNVTALKEHGWTSKLSHLLEEALVEMAALHDEKENDGTTPLIKSKL